MPELPEVENLAVELKAALEGREIASVRIRNDSILTLPGRRFEREIPGKKIIRIGRRGKFIQILLSGEAVLWFHLGMTGQLLLEDSRAPLKPHTHFILSFSDSPKRLAYRDPRRFGRIALTLHGGAAYPDGVRGLGPEPWEWEKGDFISRFRQRRGRIKNLLLNQKLMSGLGNIYADESLHRSGIHPLRRPSRVPRRRLMVLHSAICEVLEEAIRHGGSTIDDFVHLDGRRGGFQALHRVYGRDGKGCLTCGTPIRRIRISGRSSFFCPQCQH